MRRHKVALVALLAALTVGLCVGRVSSEETQPAAGERVWLRVATPPLVVGDLSPKDVQELLLRYDTEFLSSFDVRIEASIPHFPLGPGHYTAELQLTGRTGECYLKHTTAKLGKLGYSSGGRRTDYYDPDGNVLVGHNSSWYVVMDEARAVRRSDAEAIDVSAEGKVVRRTEMKPVISKYPPAHKDVRSMVFRYFLALGRGYSQLISHVDDVSPQSGGLVTVRGRGKLFSAHPGKWELELAPGEQFLVRKAVFTDERAGGPTLVCESKGSYASDVVIAQEGTFALGDYKESVSVAHYLRAMDEGLKAELLRGITVLPPGTLIMDYSGAGGPAVTLVPGAPAEPPRPAGEDAPWGEAVEGVQGGEGGQGTE